MPVIGTACEAPRTLHQVVRIGNSPEMDRGIDQTPHRRSGVDCAVQFLEHTAIDTVGLAASCIARLHEMLNGAIRYHGVKPLRVQVVHQPVIEQSHVESASSTSLDLLW